MALHIFNNQPSNTSALNSNLRLEIEVHLIRPIVNVCVTEALKIARLYDLIFCYLLF